MSSIVCYLSSGSHICESFAFYSYFYSQLSTMFSSAQRIIDEINEKKRMAEWKRTSTTSTVAPPPVIFHNKADLSVTNNISHESSDQCNHGFSFINLHWASFSMGLSSILAIILSIALIAGCCYVRGSRQRQSRARHTELLRTIVHGATKAISSPSLQQSGAYPGPSPFVQPTTIQRVPALPAPSDDRVIFEPSLVPARGSTSYPVVGYTPSVSSASCGLPGCSTTYRRRPVAKLASPDTRFQLTYKDKRSADTLPSAPSAIEFIPEVRATAPSSRTLCPGLQ